MSLLYNKVPESYMTFSLKVTESVVRKKDVNYIAGKEKSKNRSYHIEFGKTIKVTSIYRESRDLRIVNIGRDVVVYQLESKNHTYGIERTAKLIKKHGKVYFVHKNRKFFLKNRHVCI